VVLLPLCGTVDYLVGLELMRFPAADCASRAGGSQRGMNLALLVGGRHMGWFLGGCWDWGSPLGLSFYAFQSLTYTLDLYRRDGEGTGSLIEYLSASALERNRVKADEVGTYVLHQANVNLISRVAQALGAEQSKFFCNLGRYGNTSSVSMLIAAAEWWRGRSRKIGAPVVFAALGAGLNWGVMLAR
jgi:hypothetical protein